MGQEQINVTVIDDQSGRLSAPANAGGIDALDKRIAHLTIPGYRLTGKCGAGGMGRVYRAQQISLQREVAIKFLEPSAISAGGFRELFRREIDILARFRHPNVVTIFDAGEADGLPYFVMEYIKGVTLRRLMADNDLTTEQAIAICGKICEGLAAAHSEGVVHRDLKPENIMVSRHGVIKIMDFGVAALLNRARSKGEVHQRVFAGTRLYASPEQLDGGVVDGRTDIYSLGVMTYEMLTLSLPGAECLPPSKINPECPHWLDRFVAKMMAPSMSDRYASATDLLAALRRGQDTTTRAWVEKDAGVKAARYTGSAEDGVTLGEQISTFVSQFFGSVGCAAFTLSLFIPYMHGFSSNLDWDRSLQDAKYTKAPITAVIVGLACLSLTTSCLQSRTGRGILQIMLACLASMAMLFILQQIMPAQWLTWQTVRSQLDLGSGLYVGGAVSLLLGGLVSVRGVAAKVIGFCLHFLLLGLFIFRNKLLPV